MQGVPGQLDINNMRDFVQKNSLERVAHEKRTKSIEHQKKAFVRQFSKDEQEVKGILQRLHVEQQIYDVDYVYPDPVESELEESNENEEVFVNPYPVTIIPKFSQTPPRQGAVKKKNISDHDPVRYRSGRRKSLEYEDIPTLGDAKQIQQARPSVTSVSSCPMRTRKLSSTSDQPEVADIWVGDPEFISSVRRPRKTSSDINHRKLLQRAMSDVQTNAECLSRLSILARKCSTEDLQKDLTTTPITSKKERKINNDENFRNNSSQDVTSSSDRDRKLSFNKDAHALAPKEERHYQSRSGKSTFENSSKLENEMKYTNKSDAVDSERKENDVRRTGKPQNLGTGRIRKMGRAENEHPVIDPSGGVDQKSEIKNKKRVLKKKRSMPEINIGSPQTIVSEDNTTDPRPRTRHGSLKEKPKEKAHSRPRNGSFN